MPINKLIDWSKHYARTGGKHRGSMIAIMKEYREFEGDAAIDYEGLSREQCKIKAKAHIEYLSKKLSLLEQDIKNARAEMLIHKAKL